MNDCVCTLGEDIVRCIPKIILTYLTQISEPYRNRPIDWQHSENQLTGFYVMGIWALNWLIQVTFYAFRILKWSIICLISLTSNLCISLEKMTIVAVYMAGLVILCSSFFTSRRQYVSIRYASNRFTMLS